MNTRIIFLVASVLFFGISEPGWTESPANPEAPTARALVQNQVSLSWVPVPGAEGYRIYRRTFEGPWVRIPEIQETTFFEDTKLQSGFEYSYEIAAVNSRGEGARSRAVTVRTKAPKVSGLKAVPGDRQVELEWNHAPGAIGYRIYRDTLGGTDGPRTFRVAETDGPLTFTDRGLVGGETCYYQVCPDNLMGETPTLTATVSTVPWGSRASTPDIPVAIQKAPSVPHVTAIPGNRSVVLSGLTTGTRWALYRSTAPGAEIEINEGLVGRSYIDTGLANGTTYYYQFRAVGTDGLGPATPEVWATPGGPPARPWLGPLDFGIPGEPVQTGTLMIPDTQSPVRGAAFFTGVGSETLARVRQVAVAFNLAVFDLENFNFGTKGNPIYLKTDNDSVHTVQILDIRWPVLGAARVQAALDAAVRLFPGHPEIARGGLVFFGFSMAVDSNGLTMAQPALAHRILAVVDLCEFDEDRWCPMEVVGSVPHLFVASGRNDPASNLNLGLMDYKSVSHDTLARALATRKGAPLTVVTNIGHGHGQDNDLPFASIWLADVLAQRIPAEFTSPTPLTVPGWAGVKSWAGFYDVAGSWEFPWGQFLSPGVRMANLGVETGDTYRDPRPFTWLPSRNTAYEWKRYEGTGTPTP